MTTPWQRIRDNLIADGEPPHEDASAWDNETAPAEARQRFDRGLTHSSDSSREGLAMKATRNTPIRMTLAERLWSRVEKPNPTDCWEWQGATYAKGHGAIARGRRGEGMIATHRAAWELTHGSIPEGMVVCHACDNPPCCNPNHLFLGTVAANNADCKAKGRTHRGYKLSDDDVREIRSRYVSNGPGRPSNAAALADEFGITKSFVLNIVNGHGRKRVS